MSDLLSMEKINKLPHPLTGKFCGGDEWPIYDIDVESGLLRIDVCGLLQTNSFGELILIIDATGNQHDVDMFYTDAGES